MGAKADGINPTYVYPSVLKAVVRARFPQEVKDWEGPTGPQVPKINQVSEQYLYPAYLHCIYTGVPRHYSDLWIAKWPASKAPKKTKNKM